MIKTYTNPGFTIVELLIVIVVIGILATITVVAYNGIQDRAADVAIKSDLSNMGKLLMAEGLVTNGSYPNDASSLSQVGLGVSKSSYGSHFVDTGTGFKYNALYCSTIDGYSPSKFAIIAGSKSGNYFIFADGHVADFPSSSWVGGWGTMCPAALEVSAGNSAAGIWLYENSIWKIWLK